VSRALRVATLGVCLCLLAGAFAISPLYVPGVALVVLALAAAGTVRLAALGAGVTLELPARSVEEGSPAALVVHARGWSFALSRAELRPTPGAAASRPSPRGAAREFHLRPARRGEYPVGPATVRFADPFGICVRQRSSAAGRLLVLPRIEQLSRGQLELLLASRPARASREDGAEVDGLRPYRPGAPASRIHWLSVARTGQLVERRAQSDTDGMPVMIVLDASSPDSQEALDMAVRAAASLCVGLAGMGGCSLLLPAAEDAQPLRADLSSWAYLHARLALLQGGQAPVWRVVERAPLAIWVGASSPQPRRGSGPVALTVSPSPLAGRPVSFRVAGCAVQRAGHRGARETA
jgi:uncharacterized protein (DUF58 family)